MVHSQIRGHQVICSAFIERDNKVCIIMCPKFRVWRVPGGRAEWGEKIEDTLIREMQEETGITFTNPKFVGWGQDEQFKISDNEETSRLIMFFHVQTDKDPNLDPDEAIDHKWVTLEELRNIKTKNELGLIFFEGIQIFHYKRHDSIVL